MKRSNEEKTENVSKKIKYDETILSPPKIHKNPISSLLNIAEEEEKADEKVDKTDYNKSYSHLLMTKEEIIDRLKNELENAKLTEDKDKIDEMQFEIEMLENEIQERKTLEKRDGKRRSKSRKIKRKSKSRKIKRKSKSRKIKKKK